MIRGISRQIIEVRETGNVYYEKAYFIVKPEYDNAERELLEREARKVLKKMDAPSNMKRKSKAMLLKGVLMLGCVIFGILLSYLLFAVY